MPETVTVAIGELAETVSDGLLALAVGVRCCGAATARSGGNRAGGPSRCSHVGRGVHPAAGLCLALDCDVDAEQHKWPGQDGQHGRQDAGEIVEAPEEAVVGGHD